VEKLGDFARGEVERVTQQQDGALARRQVLERRDERELDVLALLLARRRRRGDVVGTERLVRVGLDPHRLG
jgi:hypothetical protein